MESVNYSVSSRRSGLAMKLAIFAGIYSLAIALLVGFAGGVYDWAGYGAFGLGAVPFAVATLFSIAAAVYGMLAGSAAEEEYPEKRSAREGTDGASPCFHPEKCLPSSAPEPRCSKGRRCPPLPEKSVDDSHPNSGGTADLSSVRPEPSGLRAFFIAPGEKRVLSRT